MQGAGSNAFVAREETLCNLLPREVTLRLINQNPRFASFFYLDIARKLDALSRKDEAAGFAPLVSARVSDLFRIARLSSRRPPRSRRPAVSCAK